MRWTIKTASEAVGGLSNPSKMPSLGTSTPAEKCGVGSRLRAVPGTVCSKCYAHKGSYVWSTTQAAMDRRYSLVLAACEDPIEGERWIDAFSFLLNRKLANQRKRIAANPAAPIGHDARYFRWHDSGDLISAAHLGLISGVAARTPEVSHWLPTRELAAVLAHLRAFGGFPDNLTVRLSAAKIDTPPPAVPGCVGSAVHSEGEPIGFGCPAYSNDGECGECRACWDRSVPVTSYPEH